MNKTFITLLITIMTLTPGLVCVDPIQLFHYEHPSHSEQVAYILGIATYMMEKREWNRQFVLNEEKCPQFSREVCAPGAVCKPPTAPPRSPPNVCDLPMFAGSGQCGPGGSCEEQGTCPVKFCEIPFDLRRVVDDGSRICEPDECVAKGGNALPEDCRSVTRCDLKVYEGHLDDGECGSPDPCEVNPFNCINICDLTGDYSPCGYMDCYKMPYLPHCPKLPPPPPCPVDSTKVASDNTCCIGLDCYTAFDRCLWGRKVGERLVDALTNKGFNNMSKLDQDGNPVVQCFTEYEVKEKQQLMFQCFKSGVLDAGFEEMNEGEIKQTIDDNMRSGDEMETVGSVEEKKMTVDLTNTTQSVVNGARS